MYCLILLVCVTHNNFSLKALKSAHIHTLYPCEKKPKKPKTGKKRRLRKNHRGGIAPPKTGRNAIDVGNIELNDMQFIK